jgi:hypothetical protein
LFLPRPFHVGQERREVISCLREVGIDVSRSSSNLIVIVEINRSYLGEKSEAIDIDFEIFFVCIVEEEAAPHSLVFREDEISRTETSRHILKASNIIEPLKLNPLSDRVVSSIVWIDWIGATDV